MRMTAIAERDGGVDSAKIVLSICISPVYYVSMNTNRWKLSVEISLLLPIGEMYNYYWGGGRGGVVGKKEED